MTALPLLFCRRGSGEMKMMPSSSAILPLVLCLALICQGIEGLVTTQNGGTMATMTRTSIRQATFNTNNYLQNRRKSVELFVGSSIDPESDEIMESTEDESEAVTTTAAANEEPTTPMSTLWSTLTGGGPPLHVDDTELLLYDVFLILNLSASISFWVVHRMNFMFLASSISEGALLSICWILAGLANGAFLYSAVDGHYDPRGDDAEKCGPKAAGLLGLSTFVATANLRILFALGAATIQHRPIGYSGEDLIPLEVVFGLVLMSCWRALHSYYTPRI